MGFLVFVVFGTLVFVIGYEVISTFLDIAGNSRLPRWLKILLLTILVAMVVVYTIDAIKHF